MPCVAANPMLPRSRNEISCSAIRIGHTYRSSFATTRSSRRLKSASAAVSASSTCWSCESVSGFWGGSSESRVVVMVTDWTTSCMNAGRV